MLVPCVTWTLLKSVIRSLLLFLDTPRFSSAHLRLARSMDPLKESVYFYMVLFEASVCVDYWHAILVIPDVQHVRSMRGLCI